LVIPQTFFIRVRISDLAQYKFCPKRSKLQRFREFTQSGNKFMAKGNTMHWQYSCPYKSFDRRKLRYKLEQITHVFTRNIDNWEIRGIPDDFKVLFNPRTQEKWVSIVEIKTTNHTRLWNNEENAAIFQLQLYVWLLEPYLTRLGYKLWRRHYVEIYSQKDGKLLRRIPVEPLSNVEDTLRYIFRSYQGLEKWRYPEEWVCKRCPKNIKLNCQRWNDLHARYS
jgi:CRISPR/Cas system-associated exonuclease Cas4 (RecB family)